jgi:uncharacterized protein (TIGR02246 family)
MSVLKISEVVLGRKENVPSASATVAVFARNAEQTARMRCAFPKRNSLHPTAGSHPPLARSGIHRINLWDMFSVRTIFQPEQREGEKIMRAHLQKTVLVLAVLAAAAGGGYLAVRFTGRSVGEEPVGTPPSVLDPTTNNDEKAIRKNQEAYVKAFNAGDARALAAFWSLDGEFVDASGRIYRGRAAIEKEFTTWFSKEKGKKLDVRSDSLRFLGPGIALESGVTRLTDPDGKRSSSNFSIVHTRREGRWFLASVREIPFASTSQEEHLRDFEWLVGSWTARNGGRSVELNCEWTAKRAFLVRRYTLKEPGEETRTGLQVIGWDPLLRGVRSWTFDSAGGFGSETWVRDGKRWVIEARGVTAEGAEFGSVNILTPLDHDNFTWQSVQRSTNETPLPDTAVIKVTRVKARK